VSVVVLVGRILFCALMINNAYNHFSNGKMLSAYAKSKRVPMPEVAVFVGGVLLGLGGLSVLLGVWADLGSLMLAIFLIPTAVLIHDFWRAGPEEKMTETIHFFKDTALAGASLMMLGLFSIAGDDLGLTLTGPLFH
jgi:putative oxidoreductase